jgi:hypothetical protein
LRPEPEDLLAMEGSPRPLLSGDGPLPFQELLREGLKLLGFAWGGDLLPIGAGFAGHVALLSLVEVTQDSSFLQHWMMDESPAADEATLRVTRLRVRPDLHSAMTFKAKVVPYPRSSSRLGTGRTFTREGKVRGARS